ncbi:hypothetical protein BD410DRAFT_897012 [Rickenella mellea]|uniref:F-box domain-containing protein n=1 Tax=Rickenella mellea TaxID=50990 RepID=A0A4Y7Q9T0_9AGAM|nr:hypothetical protein BD410DRAFT_897012 [Rickenella mellea]
MSLSHVCKHFRSVALGALSLWATASLGRPIGQIQTSLERSGSVPLTIFLDQSASHNDVNDDQVVEFLELVIPHAHRWSALHVGKRVQMLSTNHVVRTKYPSLQLPRLIEIVQSPTLFSIDPFVSFLAKWATPKLVSYEFSVVKNVSPQVAILRSPITRCSVSWDKSSNTEINSIVQLLALLPTLEELEMTFIGGVNRIGSVPNQRPINIPSVTSLSLKLKLVDNPDTLLHGLLTLAQLPNVTSLEYLSAQSWTLEGIKHVLFAPNGLPRFEKLEKLDIHDDIMQPKGGIVESVISGYPSLLYLSLHLPTASLYEEGFRWKLNSRTIPEVWISKFSLQTLRLISCDAVTPQEMSFLVCNIRGSPSWDKFLRLDVFDCKHLTEYYYGIWDECLEGKMSWSKWILL